MQYRPETGSRVKKERAATHPELAPIHQPTDRVGSSLVPSMNFTDSTLPNSSLILLFHQVRQEHDDFREKYENNRPGEKCQDKWNFRFGYFQ